MSWETRKGNRYFYRKHRRGGRVVAEYLGRGTRALFHIVFDGADDDIDAWKRLQDKKLERGIDRRLDFLDFLVQSYVTMHLVSQGFNRHRGQWRRRRGEESHEA
jgi:hypothetical protein